MDDAVLATSGLTKAYGPVEALKQVDFHVRPAEVVGLVGDNGAGKSTLVGCLSGSITPSRGEILFDGAPVTFASPRDAQALGVQTVYQDLSLRRARRRRRAGRRCRPPTTTWCSACATAPG